MSTAAHIARPPVSRPGPTLATTTSVPARQRWAWRVASTLPFVGAALIAHRGGFDGGDNETLLHDAATIRWGSTSLSFIAHIFPPIPSAIASFLPNALVAAVLGAAAAGVALEAMLYRLRREGRSWWSALLLIGGLALTPGFVIAATTDLATFSALMFLVLALDGFSRFVGKAETVGGFQAGLAIGLATLCDAEAIVFALGFAISAPLLARARFRGERAAGRATATVLVFPTVAGLVGWTFLCWRFTGSPLVWIQALPHAPGWRGVARSLQALGRAVPLTPVYVTALALLTRRRRWPVLLTALLPPAAVAVVALIGQPVAVGPTTVLLGVVGVVILPRRWNRWETSILCAAVIGGLILTWMTITSPVTVAWLHAVHPPL